MNEANYTEPTVSDSPSIAEKLASPKHLYLFVREEGFYPVELPELTVADNAARNPGTLKVIHARSGLVVWEQTP